MKLTKLFAAAFVALLLCSSHASAADPEETFLLTPALLAKLKAAAPELRKLDKKERDDSDEKNNPSAEEFARIIDKEQRANVALLRKTDLRAFNR